MLKRMLHTAQTILTEPIEAEGTKLELKTVKAPLKGLHVYGRSTQDGTPTPENPVEIVSVENPVVEIPSGEYAMLLSDVQWEWAKENINIWNNDKTFLVLFKDRRDLVAYINITSVQGVLYSYTESYQVGYDGNIKHTTNGGFGYNENFLYIVHNTGYNYFRKKNYRYTLGFHNHSERSQKLSLVHTILGIPVSSDGNYTDESGQQWICDEVDFERGKYVKNVYLFRAPQTNWALIGTNNSFIEFFNNNAMYEIYGTRLQSGTILTTHFGSSNNNIFICGDATHLYARFPVSSGIDTVEKANEFFANNEVMCYGILEDSIETDLTAEEIVQYKALHSNYPATIITNSEDAYMKVNCLKILGA